MVIKPLSTVWMAAPARQICRPGPASLATLPGTRASRTTKRRTLSTNRPPRSARCVAAQTGAQVRLMRPGRTQSTDDAMQRLAATSLPGLTRGGSFVQSAVERIEIININVEQFVPASQGGLDILSSVLHPIVDRSWQRWHNNVGPAVACQVVESPAYQRQGDHIRHDGHQIKEGPTVRAGRAQSAQQCAGTARRVKAARKGHDGDRQAHR